MRTGLQAHRHLRGGVRVVHALHVQHVRARVRGGADRQQEGRHPRQRAEPHRPGHRVRLLLLSCGLRLREGRARDHHDQLQSGDGVDRLRHRRPPLLRAADLRGRDGRARPRARGQRRCLVVVQFGGQTPLKLALPLQEAGRDHPRHLARLDRPGRGPQALLAAAVGSRAFRSRPAARRCRAPRRARRPAKIGFPVVVRPSYVLGGRGDGHRLRHGVARSLHGRRPSTSRTIARS